MQNIKSVIIGLLLGFTFLIGLAITASLIYEEEVSQYLVEELNEYLLSEIEVGDINLSVIKKFPKASLEFKDVIAYTKLGYLKQINNYNTDTLFYAKSLSIQINLLDLLTKEYNIKSLHFDSGKINLFIDRFGDQNYIFWDKSNKEESSDFKMDLNQVKITNTQLLYYNEATDLDLRGVVKRIDFQGNFSNQNYLMKIKSDFFTQKLEVNGVNYINNKRIKTDLNLDIINKNIKISNGKLNFNKLNLTVNGDVLSAKDQGVDFVVSGNNLNIESFINNLPQNTRNEFSSFNFKNGEVTFNLKVSGGNIKYESPHIEALFDVKNAQLVYLEKDIDLTNLTLEGGFSNGSGNNRLTSKIQFKNFETNLESNYFLGNFELENLKEPQIQFDISSELYLHEIKDIFKLDTFDIFSGSVMSEAKYKGTYKELKEISFQDLFTKDYNINVRVTDGELKIKDNPVIISDLNGSVEINKTLYTDSVYFKISDNDFLINGRILGLYEFFNEQKAFDVQANLTSEKIDLNELAPLFKVDKMEDENSSYRFPEKLSLQLKLDIKNFETGKFNATNIRGNLQYKPKMFSMHEISFNSMNGEVKASGAIIQKYNNDFLVRTQSNLSNININKLFGSFNNFDQSFITNQNLEGNLTGNIYFQSEWNDKISVNKKSVNTECDMVISDGELNNFEPMLGLSRFIDVDELSNIKFSEFKNTITIKDGQIYIPQMDIQSSVLNVTASGAHGFDNKYEYHLKLLMSDLLSAKMKRSKKNNKSFGEIEEDSKGRLKLFLLLEGDNDDFNVRYDRKSARQTRKENVNEEKSDLKTILNEEFNWLKKDSSGKSIDTSFQDQFKVEFEEEKKKERVRKSSEPVQNQKFVIEWDEDSTDID
jgi:hypothetical protein